MPKDKVEKLDDLLTKLLVAEINTSKHPEKLLHRHVTDLLKMYQPKNTDQAVDYCHELVIGAAAYGAWLLGDHVADHPEDSKECCPQLLDLLVESYREDILARFHNLCKWKKLDNPFENIEPSTNEKTLHEILAQIESEGKV